MGRCDPGGSLLGTCAPQILDLHEARPSALTRETLRRTGELYVIEAMIRGKSPNRRRQARQAEANPLIDDLQRWLQGMLEKLSHRPDTSAAILYALNLLSALARYCDGFWIETDNCAAERALRGVAIVVASICLAASTRPANTLPPSTR